MSTVALLGALAVAACAPSSESADTSTAPRASTADTAALQVGSTTTGEDPSASATSTVAATSTTGASTTSTTSASAPGTTTARTSPPGTAAPSTVAPATTVPTTAVPTGWRSQLLSLINSVRANAGVAPVALCNTLNRAAQDYSGVLAGWGTLSHVGPDGSTLYTRVAAAGYGGYVTVGENLAAGQIDVTSVVNSWMGSSGHRANLLYPAFTVIGAGRTDVVSGGVTVPYWVLDLGAGGSC